MSGGQADFAKLLLKHGYTGVKKIGEGSFGVAVLVQDGDGTQSVCKSVKCGAAAMEDLLAAKKEARLLAHLQHPNIVRYRTSFLDMGWFCIVMDYCDGGSLAVQIEKSAKRSTPMPEEQIAGYIAQMAMALEYLHEKGILHRDLKPSNLFLRRMGDLVVGDFGLSKVLDCTVACAKTLVGTPYYLSPEVIQDKPYFWPSDIWSVGCIVFELAALRVPFDGANLSALAQKICFGPLPEVPPRYCTALRELCFDLMNREPGERPAASSIISRPYILDKASSVLSSGKGSAEDANPKAKNVVCDQFRRLDVNNDGVLDRAELAQMLTHLDSAVWSDKAIDDLLRSLDVNADGKVDLDEFVQWVFGGQDAAGLVARVQQHMEACLSHITDSNLDSLKDDLQQWRQSIDIGCLSILPPALCVETCDTLATLADELRRRIDACEGEDEKIAEMKRCCGLLDQMNAILFGVEQLLSDYGRHHVRRVLAVQCASPAAVMGFCCELEDGTRVGQFSGGLGDASLEAGGGKWEVFAPGEQILEVKGFGFLAKSVTVAPAPGAKSASAAVPTAEAAPKARSKFTLAGAAAKAKAVPGRSPPSRSKTTTELEDPSSADSTPAPARDRASTQSSTSSPSSRAAPEELPNRLASSLTLCTSRGRELNFGAAKSGVSLGTPFSFKAPEGEEIEDIIFKGNTCTGIRTAPTAPVLATWDFWDRRKLEKVQNAFRKAAVAIFANLVPWSWQKSERQGKYAMLQARRLDLPVELPDAVKERKHENSMSMTPPPYWELHGMKLEHGNTVGACPVKPAEQKALEEMMQSTCSRKPAREPKRSLVPSSLELIQAVRIQNWQNWSEFQAQQEFTAKELQAAKSKGKKVNAEVTGIRTAGFLEEFLGPLDADSNTVWLFHGLSDEAIEQIEESDFDIDKAGLQVGTLYGRGIYLSESCSRADEVLSTAGCEGMHAMLVCRGILGNVHVDSSTLPDMAQIVRSWVEGKCHSITAASTEEGLREFVVYDKCQVYPEFMLLYRRVYS